MTQRNGFAITDLLTHRNELYYMKDVETREHDTPFDVIMP